MKIERLRRNAKGWETRRAKARAALAAGDGGALSKKKITRDHVCAPSKIRGPRYRSSKTASLAYFADALREFLGLAPLYNRSENKTDEERFALARPLHVLPGGLPEVMLEGRIGIGSASGSKLRHAHYG